MSVREVATTAYQEAFPILSASVLGGLVAGLVLGGMEAELEAIPGLLVLVPALLATRGNVYGSLGARLSSALHQGLVEPKVLTDDRRVRAAIAAAMANGILISVFAAVAAYIILVTIDFEVASLLVLVTVALIAGVLSGIALTGAVVTVVFVGYRRGYNPDTLVGPLMTTTGDIFGIAFLLLGARLVLRLGGA